MCVCVCVCVCVLQRNYSLLSVCVLSVYYVLCVCVTNSARKISKHTHTLLSCSVQYTDSQVGSDGDLGEGEEEEGGGAGLGMGDVLGGVVTFDVTVGGATCEYV